MAARNPDNAVADRADHLRELRSINRAVDGANALSLSAETWRTITLTQFANNPSIIENNVLASRSF